MQHFYLAILYQYLFLQFWFLSIKLLSLSLKWFLKILFFQVIFLCLFLFWLWWSRWKNKYFVIMLWAFGRSWRFLETIIFVHCIVIIIDSIVSKPYIILLLIPIWYFNKKIFFVLRCALALPLPPLGLLPPDPKLLKLHKIEFHHLTPLTPRISKLWIPTISQLQQWIFFIRVIVYWRRLVLLCLGSLLGQGYC